MVHSKFFGIACGVAMLAGSVSAATLPTAKEVQAKMGMGFNVGNSMEVPNNPTLWGNPIGYLLNALLQWLLNHRLDKRIKLGLYRNLHL